MKQHTKQISTTEAFGEHTGKAEKNVMHLLRIICNPVSPKINTLAVNSSRLHRAAPQLQA